MNKTFYKTILAIAVLIAITAPNTAWADRTQSSWLFDSTGFYYPANNVANIFTSTSIGVGTTSPWGLFSIATTTGAGSVTPLFVIATTTNGTSTSTPFFVSAAGTIGIGTNNPQNGNVDIVGAAPTVVIRDTLSANQNPYLVWYTNTNTLRAKIGWDNTNSTLTSFVINNVDNTPMRFLTAGAERFRVAGTGPFFSIGSTTPAYNLTVDNGTSATTTVTCGRLGAAGSKCGFNLQTNLGASVCAYIVGTSWQIEAGTCK